ncbi:MAG TPA: NADP-dependent phosphogluconate dehydrogenase [Kofleriaceae bacterium]|nr:NADP-dependent phosphogluconate dehydrogenase [Kofleriaceae bacterium]
MRREIGVIGLGRMGGGLAIQAARKGIHVVGYDPLGHHPELQQAGVVPIRALADFVPALATPRAIFLYIPAGPDVDVLLDQLAKLLSRGDVIVDGGNSYWGDSIHRAKRLAALGIELVDAGTSGGIEGARHGACFMVGGSPAGVARVEPLLEELAVPGGYVHAGPPGAGHFTKLVHNGIEFGMLQAIGEGVDLLEHFRDQLDVAGVLACWRNGSVIRGWLIDLMHQQYATAGGMDHIPPFVEDTGEVNWLVADALRMEIAIPVIAQAVMELFASRDNQKNWARAIAMMRNGFGGHPFGPNAHVADERKHGQVDGTFRDE